MKKFFLLITLILIGICASPFFIDGPDGKPVMRTETLLPSDHSSLLRHWKNQLLLTADMVLKQGKEQLDIPSKEPEIYRWKDDSGVWQYGDTPPTNVVAEKVSLSAVKVIPSVVTKQEDHQ
jgi:hypothetical protein